MTFARTFLFALLLTLTVAAAERSPLPVTTLPGPAADLVREWWKEGTAAGNVGDDYDNRDRGHILLNLKLFPQLTLVTYNSNDLARSFDYATPKLIRTNITIANSSTSSGVKEGGSNTRQLYTRAPGPSLAYELYVRNNLHSFPEHRDHDPGHNGPEGHGDIFPVNTPYVYTSQGSSGSELPFLDAAILTVAAFRPEVKTKLAQKGLLLPTLQMLLRRSYKPASNPGDYLTGRAHPTVFESAQIDAEAMVKAAHEITLNNLPPIAKIQVVEEDRPRQGSEYFDIQRNEKLCDTPCAIGRIFRGFQKTRRMVVSAEASFDQNLRPLTWHWVVLRGDTNRIQIKPLNPRGTVVEITVAYHERRPIYPGAEIESNRIDIGCFVNNGLYYSAPAFVCYYFPDNEARAYADDAQVLDIGYAAGETRLEITDWKKFFELLAQNGLRAQFLQNRLHEDDWETVVNAADRFDSLTAAKTAAEKSRQPAHDKYYALLATARALEKESPKKTNELAQIHRELADHQTQNNHLDKKVDETTRALKDHLAAPTRILEKHFAAWVADPDFTFTNRRDLERLYKASDRPARDAFENGKELLVNYGLMKKNKGLEFSFTPIRSKPGPLEERLTPFERCLVQRLNGAVLSLLILRGSAHSQFVENFADGLITANKEWRDVFHYAPDGTLNGWTRYYPGGEPSEFNYAGALLEKGKAIRVNYDLQIDPANRFRQRLLWTRPK